MNTYIINLEKDSSNLQRTKNELKKSGFNMKNIHRFNAVNGKNINRWDEDIHIMCKNICTDKMIGCGLSHINLCKELVNKNLKYVLIVEDDILNIPSINYQKELNKTILYFEQKDPNWDIIILHDSGVCKKNEKTNGLFCGSTAAYLISNNGLKKMSQIKLGCHIDHNRNSYYFNTYSGPHLFDTNENQSKIEVLNKIRFLDNSFYYWATQDMMMIPFTNIKLNVLTTLIIQFLILLLIIYYLVFKQELNFIVLFLSFILSLIFTYIFYTNNDTSFYRCSTMTHYFGMIYPVLIIIALFIYMFKYIYVFYVLYCLSLSMLFFHLFYHYDQKIKN